MSSSSAPSAGRIGEALPGDVIAGKYRVERVLGRGGMGVVVAARHQQLDQLVALKLLDAGNAREPVIVERFLREARAAAKLRSEHVAKVIDVGTQESGAPYIVMEHLEGSDLAELLDLRGPLDPETACDFVAQACEAVAEAHALGIVHRDLKPDNLFLTKDVGGQGMVKVLDFGISKVMTAEQGALTQTRAVIGSPLYMAPEQLRSSRQADPRSDVWGLGVVLYELLTRRWPFEADSLPDLCVKVAHEAPRPIAELRDDVPPGLVAVVDRCLAKDPAARFANAAELAEALEPFAPSRTKPTIESARKVMRALVVTQPGSQVGARRGKLAWTAVAVALAVAGTWTGITLARRADDRSARAVAAIDAAMTSWVVARSPAPAPAAGPAPAPIAAPAPGPASGATAGHPSLPPRVAGRAVVRRPPPLPAATSPKRVEDDIPAFR